jgi:diguanylate cyclase (GGDEF)-like protein
MTALKITKFDDLTQMPNRMGWVQAAERAIEAAENDSTVFTKAVLFIDLDRFKWVNDSLGHNAGDLLLQKVARLIESALSLRGEIPDIVGRLGGDEFVVLLQAPESIARLEQVANAIVEQLSQPILLENMSSIDNIEVEIGASIGIGRYPQDAKDIETLLKFADLSMYRAKHSGRNQVVLYQPEMLRQIERRRNVQMELRRALKEERLALDYMPVYDSRSQMIVSVEARLNVEQSPLLNNIDARDLFSIADESQVAMYLSEWMIQTALGFNQKLLEEHIEMPFILDVRPSHFHQKGFVDWFSDQLEEYEVAPELIVLSLNEACLNAQRFDVASQLSALSKLGVEIAVQGFGSGNWSLLRLHDWNIDRLHLSSRLVQEITNSRSLEAMTGALIQLGQTLNKKVIACGVRSAEQLAFLNSHQCYLMQGAFLSEVLTEHEMERSLLEASVGNTCDLAPYYDHFSETSPNDVSMDEGLEHDD